MSVNYSGGATDELLKIVDDTKLVDHKIIHNRRNDGKIVRYEILPPKKLGKHEYPFWANKPNKR